MKIVQFGFYDTTGNSIDIPHVYTQHSVAYTGTHDNEVINGWYDNLTQEQRDYTDAYINRRQGEPNHTCSSSHSLCYSKQHSYCDYAGYP